MWYGKRTDAVVLGGGTGGEVVDPCQSASGQGGPGSVVLLPAAEWDVRPSHRGGSDGVSYVRGDRRRCPSQPVDY